MFHNFLIPNPLGIGQISTGFYKGEIITHLGAGSHRNVMSDRCQNDGLCQMDAHHLIVILGVVIFSRHGGLRFYWGVINHFLLFK